MYGLHLKYFQAVKKLIVDFINEVLNRYAVKRDFR